MAGPGLDERPDPSVPHADAEHDSAALRRTRRRSMVGAATLLVVAAVGTASLLADRVRPWFQPFDDWWFDTIAALRTPWAVRAAEWLDVLGSTVVTVPLRVLALVVLVARRRWTQAGVFLAAILLSELAIGPLKALVDRTRPPDPLVATTAASFPSGHAIAASVTAVGLVIAFLPRGRRRVHWMFVAALVAGSMAWSRTYLGAHWATDTIAGVCIGVGVAVGTEVAAESWRTRSAT